jgi:hypothetical protein
MARVPRWCPSSQGPTTSHAPLAPNRWRETLFSERGTLIAIGVGYLLLWMKSAFGRI